MKPETFFITKKYIKKWCGSSSIYDRGVSYFSQGRVSGLHFAADDGAWYATVDGTNDYDVVVRLWNDEIDASCTCLAFENHWACKHIIAVLLEIEEEQFQIAIQFDRQNSSGNGKVTPTSRMYHKTNEIIDAFVNRFDLEKEEVPIYNKQPLNVEYLCRTHSAGLFNIHNLFSIELKIGVKRTYVVKNIVKFLQSVEDHTAFFFTSHFSYIPSEHYFLEEDLEIIKMLQGIGKQEQLYRNQSRYHGNNEGERALLIPPMIANNLFSKLQGRNISFEDQPHLAFQPDDQNAKPPLLFRLEKGVSGEFQLDLSPLLWVSYYGPYGWLVTENTVYKLSATQKKLFHNIYRLWEDLDGNILPVAKTQMGKFISYVMPGLKKIGQVEMAEEVKDQIINPPLHVKVYLDRQEERLFAKVEYHYGNLMIDPFQPEQGDETESGLILIRETEKEQQVMKIIESTAIKYNGKECYVEGEEETFDFLFTAVPKLHRLAEVYMTDGIKALLQFKQYEPVTKIEMDSGGTLLQISFDMEGIDGQEVSDILQSVVEKKKYYRLSNGAYLSLEDDGFQTMNRLFKELQINKDEVQEGVMQLPVYRCLQISDIMNGVNPYAAKLGKNFRRLIQDLKNPDTLDYEVPESLTANLRDYQQFGYQWLKTMAHYRLGGILADDMGLGKTIQAITYLLSEKKENKNEGKPSLIVSPASLVYNWKSEFDKFAPDLEVVVAYGAPEERYVFLRDHKPDVFITSYPLLRQDLELYENVDFDSLILDEAQAIKNHLTKTAKAVKQIKATKRFALSGTPIENSLDELWSIFDGILPGFFRNHQAFRNMEQERIAHMVRPFILRRVKQDVLKELPEKIETVYQSELTKLQKELYIGYLEKIKKETKESIQKEGFDKSRMKILAGLTRLRQLCCHPGLFLENYEGPSGKLEQLMEIIETALENKHRILVFSQFTSMLHIIREELNQTNVGYFYLDGQTPSKERVEMTERFNEGENELFLISLKAGGTGLNLTGADTVILYDLWWNPAVEEQAAGRAHRMGQKNNVQVIRLITHGTIEEKIYEMQQRKKELIEQVIQPGEAMLTSISEEEILEILGI